MLFEGGSFKKIKKIVDGLVLPVVMPLVEGLSENDVAGFCHYLTAAIRDRAFYGEKPETANDREVCPSVESAKMRLLKLTTGTSEHHSLREEL